VRRTEPVCLGDVVAVDEGREIGRGYYAGDDDAAARAGRLECVKLSIGRNLLDASLRCFQLLNRQSMRQAKPECVC
jgi:hypothetical protein